MKLEGIRDPVVENEFEAATVIPELDTTATKFGEYDLGRRAPSVPTTSQSAQTRLAKIVDVVGAARRNPKFRQMYNLVIRLKGG